jgi:hypothetical protein
MEPPLSGWTTHQSIVNYDGKWYLFYHDSELSGGETQLRGMKFTEIDIDDNGNITTHNPRS